MNFVTAFLDHSGDKAQKDCTVVGSDIVSEDRNDSPEAQLRILHDYFRISAVIRGVVKEADVHCPMSACSDVRR